MLAGAMSLVLGWLTWQVRRELDPSARKTTTARAYRKALRQARRGGHCAPAA